MGSVIIVFVIGFEIFPLEVNDDERKTHCELWKKVVKGNREGKLHSVIKEHFFHKVICL